jgi:D-beta-D-heptose 7-phosphate kinase/D-beta-D-heptose 1-phosphate adenosyltransferase
MRVLVIGDSCIDKFVYCNISRLCPEAPVPVLNPVSETENPGMAGNVVANLESLGCETYIITNSSQIKKTRYVDDKSGQMIMRFDENDVAGKCELEFDKYLKQYRFDAVVISDYNKGFLTEEIISEVAEICKCPTFLDTKKKLGKWCHNIDFIKINEPEWNSNKDYDSDNVIVTKGSKGASYKDSVFKVKNKVNVSNVSGAGDTFMAGLVYKYVMTNSIKLSIVFANECALNVVQKRGVVTV